MKYKAEKITWEMVDIGEFRGLYTPYHVQSTSIPEKYQRFELLYDQDTNNIKAIVNVVKDADDFAGTFILYRGRLKWKKQGKRIIKYHPMNNAEIISLGDNYLFDGDDFAYIEERQLTKEDLVNL